VCVNWCTSRQCLVCVNWCKLRVWCISHCMRCIASLRGGLCREVQLARREAHGELKVVLFW
jgi:hypothetical protein